jgi:hypothetical protein
VTETAETGSSSNDEPEPSRTTFADSIRRQPAWVLFTGAAAILAVGLVVGMAIGWKVEQNRAKEDIERVREQLRANQPDNGTPNEGAGPSVRVIGTVTAAVDDSVTIELADGNRRELAFDDALQLEKTAPAEASDLTSGTRLMWKNVEGEPEQAAEIIILPDNTTLGVTLTEATPTEMTYPTPNGALTVSTADATVARAEPAELADVVVGAKIAAQTRGTGDAARAVEIIVLPEGTTFE